MRWAFRDACLGWCVIALAAAGCMPLRLDAAPYEPVTSAQTWVLQSDVKASLAAGSATPLKAGTTWRQIGRVPQGDVLATADQVVTVASANMHEAAPVVAGGRLVGFYLTVGRAFTAASPAVPIALAPKAAS
jgi:hypothetical protein